MSNARTPGWWVVHEEDIIQVLWNGVRTWRMQVRPEVFHTDTPSDEITLGTNHVFDHISAVNVARSWLLSRELDIRIRVEGTPRVPDIWHRINA